jgi:uncharacterized protein
VTRSALVVGVTELRRHAGSRRAVEVRAAVPGLVLSSVRVPDDAELTLTGVLESLSEGLTFTGTIRVPWVAECRRCLAEVEGEVEADVREVFEPHPVEGETYALDRDHVDLEPMVRDVALLALPLAPLCREDCAGPAPDAYPATTGVERERTTRDPRWAALDDIRFE